MSQYLFNTYQCGPENERWAEVLIRAYKAKIRPKCLCRFTGEAPELYIAMCNEKPLLKRMPLSGLLHSPHCGHYEPPEQLSGLGQVSGSAIQEDTAQEVTKLALDFALTQGRSRAIVDNGESDPDSVRSDGTKLTMRATLHYLYDQARLTSWSAGMEGKRNWFIVRRELLAAAAGKQTKGKPLTDYIYIPESFKSEHEAEIANRRRASLARLAESSKNKMLLIAEIKNFEATRFGSQVVLKHVPDISFVLTEDMNKKLEKRFAIELALWEDINTTHMILIGTFSLSPHGIHTLESGCLMPVSEQWLPFENTAELKLIEELALKQRRFTKTLRYNLAKDKPLATAILQDSGDMPVAMYVATGPLTNQYEEEAKKLNAATGMTAWHWDAVNDNLPALPPRKLATMERPDRPSSK